MRATSQELFVMGMWQKALLASGATSIATLSAVPADGGRVTEPRAEHTLCVMYLASSSRERREVGDLPSSRIFARVWVLSCFHVGCQRFLVGVLSDGVAFHRDYLATVSTGLSIALV